ATAMAWTEYGGEIMPVEVSLVEGKGGVQITGQVGNVMQESAQAALTYLKSRAEELKLNVNVFEKIDIHIHIPEGAVPKDGPSAGITICTALVSAFTGREVLKEVAMTGEITLRGRILPVGGIRDKVLAAYRVGLKKIIIPKRNTKDLIDVPEKALSELEIIAVENMDQVLKIALSSQPPKSKATRLIRRLSAEANDEIEPEEKGNETSSVQKPRKKEQPPLIQPGA
ncbi:MAG: S16 family serine protease, partial [Anaerolineales bacterium]